MAMTKRFLPNKPPSNENDLKHLIKRVVFMNTPCNMPHHDREDMMLQLYTSISLLMPYITCQEISRVVARFCYRSCKELGWRKRRVEKKVIWHKPEKSIKLIDAFQ